MVRARHLAHMLAFQKMTLTLNQPKHFQTLMTIL